jgi:hypothetical protein
LVVADFTLFSLNRLPLEGETPWGLSVTVKICWRADGILEMQQFIYGCPRFEKAPEECTIEIVRFSIVLAATLLENGQNQVELSVNRNPSIFG